MKKTIILLIILLVILGVPISAQKIISLDSILLSNPSFKKVISEPQKYKLQIIFSQVIKDSTGKKSFINQSFNLNDSLYFYPASLVKLPTSIFAIELINELKKFG